MSYQVFLLVVFLILFVENGKMLETTQSAKPTESMKPTESLKPIEAANFSNRIYGGVDVQDISEFRYMGYIKTARESYVCGASIISTTHLLTTAVCITLYLQPPFLNERVVTGTRQLTGGEEHMILFVAVHPKFPAKYPEAIRYDYGIITLCAPMKFNRNQGPINLPTSEVKDSSQAIVTGWGKTEKDRKAFILQKLETTVYSPKNCTKVDGSPEFKDDVRICTISKKGKGFCVFDNGSPLVLNGEIIGLASLRHDCASGRKDMYSYVYKALDFINEEIHDSMCLE